MPLPISVQHFIVSVSVAPVNAVASSTGDDIAAAPQPDCTRALKSYFNEGHVPPSPFAPVPEAPAAHGAGQSELADAASRCGEDADASAQPDHLDEASHYGRFAKRVFDEATCPSLVKHLKRKYAQGDLHEGIRDASALAHISVKLEQNGRLPEAASSKLKAAATLAAIRARCLDLNMQAICQQLEHDEEQYRHAADELLAKIA